MRSVCTACWITTLVFAMGLLHGASSSARAASPSAAAAAPDQDDDAQTLPLLVMADFNRDGIADIAEVTLPGGDHRAPHVLNILLGQPNGTFKPAASLPLPGNDPRAMMVGDFNKDGFLDLIVGNGDGSITELLGDGKGTLVSAGEIARVGAVESIAVGDFNHDGILDMVVSDSRSNAATVFLGNGNGSFRSEWSFGLPVAGDVYRLAVADFNGDGIPDLAVTNEDQDSFDVLVGNGNGTFTYTPALSNIKDPNAHCVT